MPELDVGEKYLSISILGSINTAVFKNKDKKKDTDPDFTGNGVAVWIKEKKAKTEKISHEGLL